MRNNKIKITKQIQIVFAIQTFFTIFVAVAAFGQLKINDIPKENIGYTILFVVTGIAVVISTILGIFMSKMINKTSSGLLNKISKISNFVMTSSIQLTNAGQSLSRRTSQQAGSIKETLTTMDETTSMLEQNADNTKKANELSNDASLAAIEGSGKMKDMNDTMDELKESSTDIAKIIKVIDEIAFQTNMLALNAAVEAARAGDAGQGFAVVAEEVRNLAQKSAQAAKDTTVIIDKNIELSDHGVIISDEVGYALDDITEKINNINKIMSEISVASEEQARGTMHVTQSIGQMENLVQQNALSAKQSASSANELQNKAKELEDVASDLNVIVHGSKKAKNIKGVNDNALIQQKVIEKPIVKNKEAVKQIISPYDVIPLENCDDF